MSLSFVDCDKWEHGGVPPVTLVHTTCGNPMHTVAVCELALRAQAGAERHGHLTGGGT